MDQKEVSIEYVVKSLGIDKAAFELIANMEFHLITNEDKLNFIDVVRNEMNKIDGSKYMVGRIVRRTLRNIRLKKLRNTTIITLSDYLSYYKSNKKVALEQLLQEEIHPAKMRRFEESGLLAEELFNIHKQYPEARLMSLIRKRGENT